jgi:hypothetical protein
MVSPARSPNHCRAKTNKMLIDSTQSISLVKGEFPDYIESSPPTSAFQLFKWCLKRSEKHEKVTKVAYTDLLPRVPIPRFCRSRCGSISHLPSPYAGSTTIYYHRLDRKDGDKLANLFYHFLPLLMPPISSGAAATLPRRKAGTDGQSLSAEESNESLRTSHDSLAAKVVTQ